MEQQRSSSNDLVKSPSRFSRPLRLVSALLVVTFFVQDLSWAQGGAPVWSTYKNAPGPSYLGAGALNIINVPRTLGSPQAANFAAAKDTIVHIQDAHDSLEAQQKITAILSVLAKDYQVKSVALEGSSGAIDTLLFKTYPDRELAKKSAEELVKEGRLNAGELFAITAEEPVSVYGAEDRTLYRHNLKVFQDLLANKEKIERDLKGLSRTLEVLGERIYGDTMKQIRRNDALAEQGQLSFTKRLEFLEGLSFRAKREISKDEISQSLTLLRNDTGYYPNLQILSQVAELEKEINFDKANEEREDLLEKFKTVLKPEDLEKVVKKSLEFKAGKISDSDFHLFVSDMAHRYLVNPDPYPNLARYTEYLLLFDTIDLSYVFKELEAYEESIKKAYFLSEDEKILNQIEKEAKVLIHVVSGTASSEEFESFRAQREISSEISQSVAAGDLLRNDALQRLAQKHHVPLYEGMKLERILEALPTAIRFYTLAKERDNALIGNTLKKMQAQGQHVAALVTGGFHTQGISNILKNENLSYLIVLPKISDPNKKRPYITIITRKAKEYEKAFSSSASRYQIVIGTLLDSDQARKLGPAEVKQILKPLLKGLEETGDAAKEIEEWMNAYETAFEERQKSTGQRIINFTLHPKSIREILYEMAGVKEPATSSVIARPRSLDRGTSVGAVESPVISSPEGANVIPAKAGIEPDPRLRGDDTLKQAGARMASSKLFRLMVATAAAFTSSLLGFLGGTMVAVVRMPAFNIHEPGDVIYYAAASFGIAGFVLGYFYPLSEAKIKESVSSDARKTLAEAKNLHAWKVAGAGLYWGAVTLSLGVFTFGLPFGTITWLFALNGVLLPAFGFLVFGRDVSVKKASMILGSLAASFLLVIALGEKMKVGEKKVEEEIAVVKESRQIESKEVPSYFSERLMGLPQYFDSANAKIKDFAAGLKEQVEKQAVKVREVYEAIRETQKREAERKETENKQAQEELKAQIEALESQARILRLKLWPFHGTASQIRDTIKELQVKNNSHINAFSFDVKLHTYAAALRANSKKFAVIFRGPTPFDFDTVETFDPSEWPGLTFKLPPSGKGPRDFRQEGDGVAGAAVRFTNDALNHFLRVLDEDEDVPAKLEKINEKLEEFRTKLEKLKGPSGARLAAKKKEDQDIRPLSQQSQIPTELLDKPLDVLDLKPSLKKTLAESEWKITTIGELVARSDRDLLWIKRFGPAALKEVKDRLTLTITQLQTSQQTQSRANLIGNTREIMNLVQKTVGGIKEEETTGKQKAEALNKEKEFDKKLAAVLEALFSQEPDLTVEKFNQALTPLEEEAKDLWKTEPLKLAAFGKKVATERERAALREEEEKDRKKSKEAIEEATRTLLEAQGMIYEALKDNPDYQRLHRTQLDEHVRLLEERLTQAETAKTQAETEARRTIEEAKTQLQKAQETQVLAQAQVRRTNEEAAETQQVLVQAQTELIQAKDALLQMETQSIQEKQQAQTDVVQLQRKVEELENKQNVLVEAQSEALEGDEEAKRIVRRLQEEVQGLTTERNELKITNELAAQREKTQEERLRRLEEDRQNTQKQLYELGIKFDAANEIIQKLEEEKAELLSRITQLDNALAQAQSDALQGSEEAKRTVAILRAELETAKEEIKRQEATTAKALKDADALILEERRLKEEALQKLQEEKRQMQERLDRLEKELHQIVTRLEEVTNAKSAAEEEARRASELVLQKEAALIEANNQLDQIQKQVDETSKEADEDNKEAQRIMLELRGRIHTLETGLKTQKSLVEAAQIQVGDQADEIERLQRLLQDKAQEEASEEVVAQELREDLNGLKQKLGKSLKNIKAAKEASVVTTAKPEQATTRILAQMHEKNEKLGQAIEELEKDLGNQGARLAEKTKDIQVKLLGKLKDFKHRIDEVTQTQTKDLDKLETLMGEIDFFIDEVSLQKNTVLKKFTHAKDLLKGLVETIINYAEEVAEEAVSNRKAADELQAWQARRLETTTPPITEAQWADFDKRLESSKPLPFSKAWEDHKTREALEQKNSLAQAEAELEKIRQAQKDQALEITLLSQKEINERNDQLDEQEKSLKESIKKILNQRIDQAIDSALYENVAAFNKDIARLRFHALVLSPSRTFLFWSIRSPQIKALDKRISQTRKAIVRRLAEESQAWQARRFETATSPVTEAQWTDFDKRLEVPKTLSLRAAWEKHHDRQAQELKESLALAEAELLKIRQAQKDQALRAAKRLENQIAQRNRRLDEEAELIQENLDYLKEQLRIDFQKLKDWQAHRLEKTTAPATEAEWADFDKRLEAPKTLAIPEAWEEKHVQEAQELTDSLAFAEAELLKIRQVRKGEALRAAKRLQNQIAQRSRQLDEEADLIQENLENLKEKLRIREADWADFDKQHQTPKTLSLSQAWKERHPHPAQELKDSLALAEAELDKMRQTQKAEALEVARLTQQEINGRNDELEKETKSLEESVQRILKKRIDQALDPALYENTAAFDKDIARLRFHALTLSPNRTFLFWSIQSSEIKALDKRIDKTRKAIEIKEEASDKILADIVRGELKEFKERLGKVRKDIRKVKTAKKTVSTQGARLAAQSAKDIQVKLLDKLKDFKNRIDEVIQTQTKDLDKLEALMGEMELFIDEVSAQKNTVLKKFAPAKDLLKGLVETLIQYTAEVLQQAPAPVTQEQETLKFEPSSLQRFLRAAPFFTMASLAILFLGIGVPTVLLPVVLTVQLVSGIAIAFTLSKSTPKRAGVILLILLSLVVPFISDISRWMQKEEKDSKSEEPEGIDEEKVAKTEEAIHTWEKSFNEIKKKMEAIREQISAAKKKQEEPAKPEKVSEEKPIEKTPETKLQAPKETREAKAKKAHEEAQQKLSDIGKRISDEQEKLRLSQKMIEDLEEEQKRLLDNQKSSVADKIQELIKGAEGHVSRLNKRSDKDKEAYHAYYKAITQGYGVWEEEGKPFLLQEEQLSDLRIRVVTGFSLKDGKEKCEFILSTGEKVTAGALTLSYIKKKMKENTDRCFLELFGLGEDAKKMAELEEEIRTLTRRALEEYPKESEINRLPTYQERVRAKEKGSEQFNKKQQEISKLQAQLDKLDEDFKNKKEARLFPHRAERIAAISQAINQEKENQRLLEASLRSFEGHLPAAKLDLQKAEIAVFRASYTVEPLTEEDKARNRAAFRRQYPVMSHRLLSQMHFTPDEVGFYMAAQRGEIPFGDDADNFAEVVQKRRIAEGLLIRFDERIALLRQREKAAFETIGFGIGMQLRNSPSLKDLPEVVTISPDGTVKQKFWSLADIDIHDPGIKQALKENGFYRDPKNPEADSYWMCFDDMIRDPRSGKLQAGIVVRGFNRSTRLKDLVIVIPGNPADQARVKASWEYKALMSRVETGKPKATVSTFSLGDFRRFKKNIEVWENERRDVAVELSRLEMMLRAPGMLARIKEERDAQFAKKADHAPAAPTAPVPAAVVTEAPKAPATVTTPTVTPPAAQPAYEFLESLRTHYMIVVILMVALAVLAYRLRNREGGPAGEGDTSFISTGELKAFFADFLKDGAGLLEHGAVIADYWAKYPMARAIMNKHIQWIGRIISDYFKIRLMGPLGYEEVYGILTGKGRYGIVMGGLVGEKEIHQRSIGGVTYYFHEANPQLLKDGQPLSDAELEAKLPKLARQTTEDLGGLIRGLRRKAGLKGVFDSLFSKIFEMLEKAPEARKKPGHFHPQAEFLEPIIVLTHPNAVSNLVTQVNLSPRADFTKTYVFEDALNVNIDDGISAAEDATLQGVLHGPGGVDLDPIITADLFSSIGILKRDFDNFNPVDEAAIDAVFALFPGGFQLGDGLQQLELGEIADNGTASPTSTNQEIQNTLDFALGFFNFNTTYQSLSPVDQAKADQILTGFGADTSGGTLMHASNIQIFGDNGIVMEQHVTSAQDTAIQNWFTLNLSDSPINVLESYRDDPALAPLNQGFTYDNAIGAMSLTLTNVPQAQSIFDTYYTEYQTQVGGGGFTGFFTVYNTQNLTDPKIESVKRMGENAFAGLMAYNIYLTTSESDIRHSQSLELATAVGQWITSLNHLNGGIAQGAVGSGLENLFSTENNADAYKLFRGLALDAVTPADRTLFQAEANGVENWLITQAFNPGQGLFRRGFNGLVPDNTAALDANTFTILSVGIARLEALGINVGNVISNIENTMAVQDNGTYGGNILTAKGFDFSDAAGTGRSGVKWVEGTNQMIRVYRAYGDYLESIGDLANATLYRDRVAYFESRNVENSVVQGPATSFVYADVAGVMPFSDSTFATAAGPAVSSTAWVSFVSFDANPFNLLQTVERDHAQTLNYMVEVDDYRTTLQARPNAAQTDNFIVSVFGENGILNGYTAQELGVYAPLIVDATGTPRNATQSLDYLDAANRFRTIVVASPIGPQVNQIIIDVFGGTGVIDGYTPQELSDYSPIFADQTGAIRDPQVSFNGFAAASNLLTTYGTFSVQNRARIDSFTTRIDVSFNLSNRYNSPAELEFFIGSSFDVFGTLIPPQRVLRNDILMENFLRAYESPSLTPANRLKVDQVLALFNINLTNGLQREEIARLLDNGVVFGSPAVTIRFYIGVVDFNTAFQALKISDPIKAGKVLEILNILGIQEDISMLTNQPTLVTAANVRLFADRGIILTGSGDLRNVQTTFDFYAAAIDLRDSLIELNQTDPTLARAIDDLYFRTFGFRLLDGIQDFEVERIAAALFREDGSVTPAAEVFTYFKELAEAVEEEESAPASNIGFGESSGGGGSSSSSGVGGSPEGPGDGPAFRPSPSIGRFSDPYPVKYFKEAKEEDVPEVPGPEQIPAPKLLEEEKEEKAPEKMIREDHPAPVIVDEPTEKPVDVRFWVRRTGFISGALAILAGIALFARETLFKRRSKKSAEETSSQGVSSEKGAINRAPTTTGTDPGGARLASKKALAGFLVLLGTWLIILTSIFVPEPAEDKTAQERDTTPPPAKLDDKAVKAQVPVNIMDAEEAEALALRRRNILAALPQKEELAAEFKDNFIFTEKRYDNQLMVSWAGEGGLRDPKDWNKSKNVGGEIIRYGKYMYPPNFNWKFYDSFVRRPDGRIEAQFKDVSGVRPEVARVYGVLPQHKEYRSNIRRALNSSKANYRYKTPDGYVYARYFDFIVADSDSNIAFAARVYPEQKPTLEKRRFLLVFPGTLDEKTIRDTLIHRDMERGGLPDFLTAIPINPDDYKRFSELKLQLSRDSFWAVKDEKKDEMTLYYPGTPRFLYGEQIVFIVAPDGFADTDRAYDFHYVDSSNTLQKRSPFLDPKGEAYRFIPGTQLSRLAHDPFIFYLGDKSSYFREGSGNATVDAFNRRYTQNAADYAELYEEILLQGGAFFPDRNWLLEDMSRIPFRDRTLQGAAGESASEMLKRYIERTVRQLNDKLNRMEAKLSSLKDPVEIKVLTDEIKELKARIRGIQRNAAGRDADNFMFAHFTSLAEARQKMAEAQRVVQRLREENRKIEAVLLKYLMKKVDLLPSDNLDSFDKKAKELREEAETLDMLKEVEPMIEKKRKEVESRKPKAQLWGPPALQDKFFALLEDLYTPRHEILKWGLHAGLPRETLFALLEKPSLPTGARLAESFTMTRRGFLGALAALAIHNKYAGKGNDKGVDRFQAMEETVKKLSAELLSLKSRRYGTIGSPDGPQIKHDQIFMIRSLGERLVLPVIENGKIKSYEPVHLTADGLKLVIYYKYAFLGPELRLQVDRLARLRSSLEKDIQRLSELAKKGDKSAKAYLEVLEGEGAVLFEDNSYRSIEEIKAKATRPWFTSEDVRFEADSDKVFWVSFDKNTLGREVVLGREALKRLEMDFYISLGEKKSDFIPRLDEKIRQLQKLASEDSEKVRKTEAALGRAMSELEKMREEAFRAKIKEDVRALAKDDIKEKLFQRNAALTVLRKKLEEFKESADYLRRRFVLHKMVSYSAVGGLRPGAERDEVRETVVMHEGRREVDRYKLGIYRNVPLPHEKNEFFMTDKEGDVTDDTQFRNSGDLHKALEREFHDYEYQFREKGIKSVRELIAKADSALNDPKAGFMFQLPSGKFCARYFDTMITTPQLEVVAAFRGGKVFPESFKEKEKAVSDAFTKAGPLTLHNISINERPLDTPLYDHWAAVRDKIIRDGGESNIWLEHDTKTGRRDRWDYDLDYLFLSGGRYLLREVSKDEKGFVIKRADPNNIGRFRYFKPDRNYLVNVGTEYLVGSQNDGSMIRQLAEVFEEMLRLGGGGMPDEAWARFLKEIEKILGKKYEGAPHQELSLKFVVGKEIVEFLKKEMQARKVQLQSQMAYEKDPDRLATLRWQFDKMSELWWRDGKSFMHVIFLSPEEAEKEVKEIERRIKNDETEKELLESELKARGARLASIFGQSFPENEYRMKFFRVHKALLDFGREVEDRRKRGELRENIGVPPRKRESLGSYIEHHLEKILEKMGPYVQPNPIPMLHEEGSSLPAEVYLAILGVVEYLLLQFEMNRFLEPEEDAVQSYKDESLKNFGNLYREGHDLLSWLHNPEILYFIQRKLYEAFHDHFSKEESLEENLAHPLVSSLRKSLEILDTIGLSLEEDLDPLFRIIEKEPQDPYVYLGALRKIGQVQQPLDLVTMKKTVERLKKIIDDSNITRTFIKAAAVRALGDLKPSLAQFPELLSYLEDASKAVQYSTDVWKYANLALLKIKIETQQETMGLIAQGRAALKYEQKKEGYTLRIWELDASLAAQYPHGRFVIIGRKDGTRPSLLYFGPETNPQIFYITLQQAQTALKYWQPPSESGARLAAKAGVLEYFRTHRLETTLHTDTGAKAYEKDFYEITADGTKTVRPDGVSNLTSLSQEVINHGFALGVDQREVFENLRAANPEAVLIYFIGDSATEGEWAAEKGANVLFASQTIAAEAIQQIQQKNPEIVIFAEITAENLTSEQMRSEIDRLKGIGVDGFILKPYRKLDPKVVSDIVNDAQYKDNLFMVAGGVFQDQVAQVLSSMPSNVFAGVGVNEKTALGLQKQLFDYWTKIPTSTPTNRYIVRALPPATSGYKVTLRAQGPVPTTHCLSNAKSLRNLFHPFVKSAGISDWSKDEVTVTFKDGTTEKVSLSDPKKLAFFYEKALNSGARLAELKDRSKVEGGRWKEKQAENLKITAAFAAGGFVGGLAVVYSVISSEARNLIKEKISRSLSLPRNDKKAKTASIVSPTILVGVTSEEALRDLSSAIGDRQDVRIIRIPQFSDPQNRIAALEKQAGILKIEKPILVDGEVNTEAKRRFLKSLDQLDIALLLGDKKFEDLSFEEKTVLYDKLIVLLPRIAPKIITPGMVSEWSEEEAYKMFKLQLFHPSFGYSFSDKVAIPGQATKAAVWTAGVLKPLFLETLEDRDRKLAGRMKIDDHLVITKKELAGLRETLGEEGVKRFEQRFGDDKIHIIEETSVQELYQKFNKEYGNQNILFVDAKEKSILRNAFGKEERSKLLLLEGPYTLTLDKVVAEILAANGEWKHLFVKGLGLDKDGFLIFAPVVPIDYDQQLGEFSLKLRETSKAA